MVNKKKNGRGANLLKVRHKSGNTTPRKASEVGDYWKKKDPRKTNNSEKRCDSSDAIPNVDMQAKCESLEKLLAEMEIDVELMNTKIDALERQLSLRLKKVTPEATETPHYIPGLYTGTHGERNGRPLTLETLRKVASICASGSQYSKMELQQYIDEEKVVPETTFYRNSLYCWMAARLVFLDSQEALVKKLLKEKKDLAIALDMGWHKRYGFNSALGALFLASFICCFIL